MWPNEYKNFSTAELEYILQDHKFKTKPMHHQLVSLAWCLDGESDRKTKWFDVGTGKSLTSLYAHQIWGFNRLLIVCPNSVVEGWEDQITEHTDFTYCLLKGSKEERTSLLHNSDADIFVLNYEGLQVIFGERVPYGKKTKWVLNRQACKDANLDGLIFDECQRLQSPDSHVTQVSMCLSEFADQLINMTATAGDQMINLHSQYLVLDGGYTLGGSRKKYLKKHFKQDFWGNWEIKDGEMEKIMDRIAPVTLQYEQDECFDLPEKRYQIKCLDMTAEQRDWYWKIKTSTSIEHDGETIDFTDRHGDILPGVVGNKLAQIAGGLLKFPNHTLRLKKQPKLDELESLIREIPGKLIIFHGYVEEGRMISERLDTIGVKHVCMRSEVKDKTGWRQLKTDPDCRVLVAHPSSGGVGLNLQVATTIIFYSNSCSGSTVRTQAEGRIWRLGQTKTCLIIDLKLRDSIDEKRLETLQERADIVASIKDYISSW